MTSTTIKRDESGNVVSQVDVKWISPDVIISGNEFVGLVYTNGDALEDKPEHILMHELVGHAIPQIVGSDTGNAVDNENKVREQLGKGKDAKRASESGHLEDPK